uniref:MT domain-containing protein n=1 Tax=Heligmosomoides polygyrus TaxID=6339 RepID=A0A8L8Q3M1_HELPZ
LLAGRPGLGRADAIRLIANMHQMALFTPKITPSYGQKQIDQELKNTEASLRFNCVSRNCRPSQYMEERFQAIQAAISNSEHVVFLLEDYKILRPGFLQSINCLISSGEVPGLFTPQMPQLLLQKRGMDVKEDTCQSFSVHKCARNSGAKFQLVLYPLKAGVSKLTEAREQVAVMQKKAAKKSKLLAEKQADADEALKDISKSMTGAEDQRSSMQQLRAATEEENAKIAEKKKHIEEQLKDVEPLLKEARSAVGSIKSESLSEIRSLRAPPEAIRDILQAVLLFMGILDTSWEAMRNCVFLRFLSKTSVKDEIINFDAHRITREVHKKVSALVKSKEASFDPKNAKRASLAAAPLAAWVTANLQYSEILEKISPLEQEKNQLVSNLSKAEKQIDKLSKGLLTVDEKVAALKERFEGLMKEATQIKIDLEKEQNTIKVAGTLVDRLAGEYSRWQVQMESLSQEMDNVDKCSIITAAFVTYLGGSSEKTRTEVLRSLQQNSSMHEFSPVTFCAMETEQLNWKNHGLPADSLSVENTVVMFNSTQTPLVIDPTGRVAVFLHSLIEKSELLRAAQNDLFTQIEFGIRFGKTIIVDDVTEVDASLVPIFRKELSSQGPRQVGTVTIPQHR